MCIECPHKYHYGIMTMLFVAMLLFVMFFHRLSQVSSTAAMKIVM